MIREAISKVVERRNLEAREAEEVMGEIMVGEATPTQIAAFITALRMKGETPEEIAGCARAMRSHAIRVPIEGDELMDTCGTGGDGAHTFNISTLTALVVAAAGVKVAKHGNRSVSSRCGSADLMEALGVRIDLGPEEVSRCIKEVNIGFLFAPKFHPAMKHAAAPRREIGIRTIFNILGPLTNPAGASVQLLGVFDPQLTEIIARVLQLLGCRRAFVVHGNGLDELSTTGVNKVVELNEARIHSYSLDPTSLGLPRARLEELRAEGLEDNVRIAESVLSGERSPWRDVVVLNAAAALAIAGKASDIASGLELASAILDRGEAGRKLEELKEFSNKVCS